MIGQWVMLLLLLLLFKLILKNQPQKSRIDYPLQESVKPCGLVTTLLNYPDGATCISGSSYGSLSGQREHLKYR